MARPGSWPVTDACAVCGGSESLVIDRREAVPVAQNLLFTSREAALDCATGALDMRRCTGCGFVWNARFDSGLLAYGEAYDNDQSFSPRFRRHTEKVAGAVAARLEGAGPIDLLEIGCGQGRFMATVARALGEGWRSGLGYDPAWQGDPAALPPNARVRGEYFGTGGSQASSNVVVSRHVIEHVPDPVAFLRVVRAAVGAGTPLFVETPDADWILRRGTFFDLYHEHCSLFTPHSLGLALAQAGFEVESVRSVFDDQYLLATAVAGLERPAAAVPGRFGDLGYPARRDRFLERLGHVIDGRDGGRLALWGGGSKGVTLCRMLPSAGTIDCAIDINERKQGAFMPCSGIPIVSPEAAQSRGITTALVMNPAYLGEIRSLCDEKGFGFELIAIHDEAGDDPINPSTPPARCGKGAK